MAMNQWVFVRKSSACPEIRRMTSLAPVSNNMEPRGSLWFERDRRRNGKKSKTDAAKPQKRPRPRETLARNRILSLESSVTSDGRIGTDDTDDVHYAQSGFADARAANPDGDQDMVHQLQLRLIEYVQAVARGAEEAKEMTQKMTEHWGRAQPADEHDYSFKRSVRLIAEGIKRAEHWLEVFVNRSIAPGVPWAYVRFAIQCAETICQRLQRRTTALMAVLALLLQLHASEFPTKTYIVARVWSIAHSEDLEVPLPLCQQNDGLAFETCARCAEG